MSPRRATLATALQALVLVLAFIGFTTVYRNTHGFSTANATRCYSLSGDHADARSLFDGDFGPLEVRLSDPVVRPELPVVSLATPVAPAVMPARRIALTASPWRRPPPIVA